MPRMTRATRRFRRAKREYIWSTVQATLQPDVTTGAESVQALVTRQDWCRDASVAGHLEKGCLVVRTLIRIDIGLPDDSSGFEQADLAVGVRVIDEDDASVAVMGVDFFDEDYMLLKGCHPYCRVTATLGDIGLMHSWEWDSRVKRKLTSESKVIVTAAGLALTAATLWNVHVFARVLLQLP